MEQKYIINHTVYNIIKIKNKYGFRVLLKFDDGSEEIRQFSGFITRKDANVEKEKVIAQLVNNSFLVSKKQKLCDFLEEWLEKDIKIRATANTYYSYKNTIKKHIIPILGDVYITELTRLQIKNMYVGIAEYSHKIASFANNTCI